MKIVDLNEGNPFATISEAVTTPKYPVGTKVGIAHAYGNDTPQVIGFGHVTGHTAAGHHEVEYSRNHNISSSGTENFNKTRFKSDGKHSNGSQFLMDEDRAKNIMKRDNDHRERINDHREIQSTMAKHTNQHGEFMGFNKESAEKLHSLISKHTS